jgi:hypothetical protein
MQVAASVTSRRHHAGATVLDKRRYPDACGSAAGLGGDVGSTDQITVPRESTVMAAEPAAVWLGNPTSADRAGKGGAPLIHQPHHHPGPLGLVLEGLEQVGTAPLPQPQVLHPARVVLGDALEVAHEQGTDPLLDGEGDYLPGGLVVGVVDAAAMARLDAAQAGSVVTPASGAALPRLWCSPGGHGAAGLLVLDVEVVLGAEGSPRHQQTRLLGDDRVGVDDAKVHPRHPARVQFVVLDGDGSGDRQPQPPAVG